MCVCVCVAAAACSSSSSSSGNSNSNSETSPLPPFIGVLSGCLPAAWHTHTRTRAHTCLLDNNEKRRINGDEMGGRMKKQEAAGLLKGGREPREGRGAK